MNKKCIGCGSILQSDDRNKIGYIIKEKISDAKYCERCFKITNYNEKIIVPLKGINTYIIDEINKDDKYVFFLVDFLNINKVTIDTFKQIKNNKTLVISKLDIIHRSIKQNLIINWLKEVYGITENIIFISSVKKLNTGSIENILERNNQKEAYILGYTNAGKSTLINKLCIENNITNNKITTSLIPNTTLDFIKIKLNDNLTIIDSPGFTLNQTLYNDNEFELIERINPKTFLKPITHQTKDITSIIIENKIRITPQNKNSLTFYTSNKINITKVFNDNNELKDNKETIYNIKDNSDIVIKGLGFINIKKECNLIINSEYQDLIEIRKSMF